MERIGLRFTVLENNFGQKIFIPNRNINLIGRYNKGNLNVNVDIQLPENIDNQLITHKLDEIVIGFFHQHNSIILSMPEPAEIIESKNGTWRYARLIVSIWPGQQALIDNTFKQRVSSFMKSIYPDFSDFMVTVTYTSD